MRAQKLVCIFVECGEACAADATLDLTGCRARGTCEIEDAAIKRVVPAARAASALDAYDDAAGELSSWTRSWTNSFARSVEFGCPMPPLSAGAVPVSFSNNRFIGEDSFALQPRTAGRALADDDYYSALGASFDDDGAASGRAAWASDDDELCGSARGDGAGCVEAGWLVLRSTECVDGAVAGSAEVSCEMCAPGTFAKERTSCAPCPVNYYTDQVGAMACDECPENTVTNTTGKASPRYCLCVEGYYKSAAAVATMASSPLAVSSATSGSRGDDDDDDGGAAAAGNGCVACPDHAVCLGGVAPPFPIHGFWTDGAAAVDEVLACEPATACLGGVESTCALGYAKARCAACARGYDRLSHYCSVYADSDDSGRAAERAGCDVNGGMERSVPEPPPSRPPAVPPPWTPNRVLGAPLFTERARRCD